MDNRSPHRIGWSTFCVVVCFILWMARVDLRGWLIWEYGRSGLPSDLLFAVIIIFFFSIAVTASLFFILISWSIGKAGWKDSLPRRAAVTVASLALAICSMRSGKPPYMIWLDGYAKRVSSNLDEQQVLKWADEVFSDSAIKQPGELHVDLPRQRIPSYFSNVFYGEVPTPSVSFSEKRTPVSINFIAGGGFGHWGVTIYNTNSAPAEDRIEQYEADYASYKCAKRIYVTAN